ncbi:hypothetical protein QCI77_16775 [Bacillus cereus group sp. MG9]|uniref:hypothetical protein n=1 Tax=Bacillus cereus group sp. MG9 TaxID=3040247 RepID=UPI003398FBE5
MAVQPLYCSSAIVQGEHNEEEGIQQLQSIAQIMKYGTRRKSNVMYSIDGMLNFIQEGLIFKCNLGLVPHRYQAKIMQSQF